MQSITEQESKPVTTVEATPAEPVHPAPIVPPAGVSHVWRALGLVLVGALLALGAGAILSGQGELDGSLINGASVIVAKAAPGLVVHGDYLQTLQGKLTFSVEGVIADDTYSTLRVDDSFDAESQLSLEG